MRTSYQRGVYQFRVLRISCQLSTWRLPIQGSQLYSSMCNAAIGNWFVQFQTVLDHWLDHGTFANILLTGIQLWAMSNATGVEYFIDRYPVYPATSNVTGVECKPVPKPSTSHIILRPCVAVSQWRSAGIQQEAAATSVPVLALAISLIESRLNPYIIFSC